MQPLPSRNHRASLAADPGTLPDLADGQPVAGVVGEMAPPLAADSMPSWPAGVSANTAGAGPGWPWSTVDPKQAPLPVRHPSAGSCPARLAGCPFGHLPVPHEAHGGGSVPAVTSDRVRERATYTVEEVAALLGISRTTAYESIRRGEIPARRFGRRVVVLRHELDRLLTEPQPG